MNPFRRWLSKYDERQKQGENSPDIPISNDLKYNMSAVEALFSLTPDLVVRKFHIKQRNEKAALIYLDSLIDKNSINNHVLYPLINELGADSEELPISVGHIEQEQKWKKIESAILQGKSVLFIEGFNLAYLLDTQGFPQRAIEDPQAEASVRGAHQGFIETGSQNISLVRRYINNRELKVKEVQVGRRAETKLSILYLEDVANPELLNELEKRIQGIDTDSVLNSGELVEYIEDNPYSPFPQFIQTERPDAAASQILQGRICVVVDRSPSVLIGPTTLFSFFQSVDDYSTRWIIASFTRLLRFVGAIIATVLPAFYIAVISFNYEMIPLKLLLKIGEFRASVPFPPFLEALIMELTLEMLREAGIRLPKPIGQTVGIVGGIVIGQAAVQAGIVSNAMVIVVSLTAIASFIIPNYDMSSAVRIIRFPLMILASLFGIVGIFVGLMVVVGHLLKLESLGTPYGNPVSPLRLSDWKDTFIRLPLWKMTTRPTITRATQSIRMGKNRRRKDET